MGFYHVRILKLNGYFYSDNRINCKENKKINDCRYLPDVNSL